MSGRSGRRWIVDPLDGTGNFIRHLPWFGVGIALATDDIVELGVVYAPITDEVFAAARGQGATLNGKRLRVSEIATRAPTLDDVYLNLTGARIDQAA